MSAKKTKTKAAASKGAEKTIDPPAAPPLTVNDEYARRELGKVKNALKNLSALVGALLPTMESNATDEAERFMASVEKLK